MGKFKRHSSVRDSKNSEPKTNLWFDISTEQWPIVYCNHYNVRFGGLEKLHPFDAVKWANIFQYLKEEGLVTEDSIAKPKEATETDLLLVHTKKYLNSLKWGWNVAAIAEIPALVFVPNFLIQKLYLRPMRFQTGGSILAGRLALERGWAINIGGGFHHCSRDKGGGFCAYADITLLVKHLFKYEPQRVRTAMIVDLDAHQGNGHERDFLGKEDKVFIMDVYNSSIYPKDREAEAAIRCKVKIAPFIEDREYLALVHRNLEKSLDSFQPDILVYNAGTDVLAGDSLGLLSVSAHGIIERDEMVFKKARERKIPIVMLTSGGYLKKTARIIGIFPGLLKWAHGC
ncbi:histone deacetylase 11 isoform X2 [Macrosteles quadrilineatus]|uniref:histone deacetylase 11 isoform X2 n=1 Tax=Macrosteles quadrilineatus TaxID=74068 RepID=UPI0023E14C67|nr:histone deacetylase 11 isoform X2 [Macrosteles quadrilineatus]